MKLYSTLARPLLFRLSPEVAHHLTITSLRIPLVSRLLSLGQRTPSDPVHLMDLSFRNRLGIAAGLDKNAEAPLAWRNLGFGFAELGTVPPHPAPGHPTPRVFFFSHNPHPRLTHTHLSYGGDSWVETKDHITGDMAWAVGSAGAARRGDALPEYLGTLRGGPSEAGGVTLRSARGADGVDYRVGITRRDGQTFLLVYDCSLYTSPSPRH